MDKKEVKITLPDEMCTGCAACMNICPVNAISMQENEYGYIHAHIDNNICIKCHLCEKTCPVYVKTSKNNPNTIYAAQTQNEKILLTSTSSGIVYSLSEKIIDLGGIVYGCSEKNYKSIDHIKVDTFEDLKLLQKSKYVQSNINFIFKEIKSKLNENILILFIGTPCQVAGLRNFLKKDFDNLLTVDLVCHGVPSQKMLKSQVESFREVDNIEPDNIFVEFRSKYLKDNKIKSDYEFQIFNIKNKRKIRLVNEIGLNSAYIRSFLTGMTIRDSCIKCLYTTQGRVSDITAGDFWGLGKKIKSNLNIENGASLVLINTNKGEKFFDKIKFDFEIEKHTFEEACLMNQNLYEPCQPYFDRKKFLNNFVKLGLEKAVIKTDYSFRFENKKLIKLLKRNKYSNFLVRILRKINKLKFYKYGQ